MENRIEDQDFFARMAIVITRRYAANADKSLRDVFDLNADFLDTESDADFAIRNRSKILAVLADEGQFQQLLALFMHLTIEFTYASNQFIQLNPREEAEIRQIYSDYLREIGRLLARSSSEAQIGLTLHTLVENHFRDLRANIARFFDHEAGEDVRANVILQKTVCAEYTPALQLEILGINIGELVPPVLDLGCGKSGKLVHFLNQQGIQAAGVDRVVMPSALLIEADWLNYPLAPQQWGTVISHMAFSNHFVFQHLYRQGSVAPYAQQYMAILRSLKAGGSFYYAPGLPFIEAYLPPQTYTVTRRKIPANDRLYACQVVLKPENPRSK